MPLPKPSPRQDKKSWNQSCMSNPVMNKEFPENDRRFAVCQSIWNRRNKKKSKGEQDFEEVASKDGKFSILITK